MQGAAPFGDPAVNVPREVREKLDGIARRIEALNPTPRPAAADKARLAGTWRVRYSDCVPPSNGQLGPLVGEPFQVVKMDGTYENRLRFLGGKLQVSSRSRAGCVFLPCVSLALLCARARGEGRGVSDQYGVRDAACPLSTRGGGGTRCAPPPAGAGACPPPPPPLPY